MLATWLCPVHCGTVPGADVTEDDVVGRERKETGRMKGAERVGAVRDEGERLELLGAFGVAGDRDGVGEPIRCRPGPRPELLEPCCTMFRLFCVDGRSMLRCASGRIPRDDCWASNIKLILIDARHASSGGLVTPTPHRNST